MPPSHWLGIDATCGATTTHALVAQLPCAVDGPLDLFGFDVCNT